VEKCGFEMRSASPGPRQLGTATACGINEKAWEKIAGEGLLVIYMGRIAVGDSLFVGGLEII
jgi:hypothetical protein